jgi:hypothetical protein
VHLLEELKAAGPREGLRHAATRLVAVLPTRRSQALLEPVDEAGHGLEGGNGGGTQRAAHVTIVPSGDSAAPPD